MRSRLLTAFAVCGLLAIGVFLVGCGSSDTSTISNEGIPKPIKVGSDIPYPPFETGTNASDYSGFDIELMNEIAKKLGSTTTVEDSPFDTIFRDLAQGKFDVVASAATITPDREKIVAFSDPYFSADQALTVQDGSDIKTTDDLGGATVGAQTGTTGADYAKNETSAKSVQTYPTIDDAYNALVNGQVDAVVNDFIPSQQAVKAKSGLVLAQQFPTGEFYGFAMQKGDTKLIDGVNSALQELKDDGTYTKLYKQYFKTEPTDAILTAQG